MQGMSEREYSAHSKLSRGVVLKAKHWIRQAFYRLQQLLSLIQTIHLRHPSLNRKP